MIEISPAIDIVSGRCVRLSKGDFGTGKVYDVDPVEMAERLSACGVRRIHAVDLDGARDSRPRNLDVLERMASRADAEIEWGGGISSADALREAFRAGASQVIVGSVAALDPGMFEDWLGQYGGGRLVLGADVREGRVSVKGWQEDTDMTVEALVERFLPYGLREVICTDISRDGMLSGPSASIYADLQRRFGSLFVTVSGGVSSMEDVKSLDTLGLKRVIVGKAIYEGRISLEEIAEWSQRG